MNKKKIEFLKKVKKIEEKGLYPIGVIGERLKKGFIPDVIRFFSNSRYHHVEILMSDGETTLGSRNFVGVDFYNINDEYLTGVDIFKFYNPTSGKIHIYSPNQRLLFYKYLRETVSNSLEYDVVGVLSVVFNKLKQDHGAYYCSELVYEVTKNSNFILCNDNHRKFEDAIYPSEILMSPRLILTETAGQRKDHLS